MKIPLPLPGLSGACILLLFLVNQVQLVQAQDLSASPLYGDVYLSGNFLPDPHTVTLNAGGADDASHLGNGCTGHINNGQPDVDLYFEAGGSSLGIFVQGNEDTTLVINAPDGEWYCNDDFADFSGTDPGVVFENPASGIYDIWVGTYGGGVSDDVELLISEYAPASLWVSDDTEATAGLAGTQTSLRESGRLESSDSELSNGEYADSYHFSGTAGDSVVVELESAEFDTYLIVTAPDGEQFYNDDFDGSQRTSLLNLDLSVSGAYEVIATSFQSGETGDYELSVMPAAGSLPSSRNESGRLAGGDSTLTSGEYYDQYEIEGVVGQTANISLSSGDFDTYLIVRNPGGDSEENDDQDGSDSFLAYTFTESGTHTLLVTSYESGETGDYRLDINYGDTQSASSGGGAAGNVQLSMGQSVGGTLTSGDEPLNDGKYRDIYSFSASSGDSVRIRLTSDDFDTYLSLVTPDGESIENDDFNGSTSESVIELDLRQTGRYRVVATSYASGETGSYQLSLGQGAGGVTSLAQGGSSPDANGGRIYGVFVGIADYPGSANDLFYTDQDAIRARDALIAGAGMRREDAITLVDDQATRENFVASIGQIARNIGPRDTFVLFYSGHGSQIERGGGFESADPDGKDETIVFYDEQMTDNELNTVLGELGNVRSLVVLDACFSGGFAKDLISVPGRMGLFSSEEDVTSQVASKFQAGGYLSVFFEEAVSGGYADYDDSGDLTAIELSQYLHERFRNDVKSFEDDYVRTAGPQSGYQHLVVDRGSIAPYDVLFRY